MGHYILAYTKYLGAKIFLGQYILAYTKYLGRKFKGHYIGAYTKYPGKIIGEIIFGDTPSTWERNIGDIIFGDTPKHEEIREICKRCYSHVGSACPLKRSSGARYAYWIQVESNMAAVVGFEDDRKRALFRYKVDALQRFEGRER